LHCNGTVWLGVGWGVCGRCGGGGEVWREYTAAGKGGKKIVYFKNHH